MAFSLRLFGRMKAEIILKALRTARDHSQAFVCEFKAHGLDPSTYHQEQERLKLYNAALKAYSEETEP